MLRCIHGNCSGPTRRQEICFKLENALGNGSSCVAVFVLVLARVSSYVHQWALMKLPAGPADCSFSASSAGVQLCAFYGRCGCVCSLGCKRRATPDGVSYPRASRIGVPRHPISRPDLWQLPASKRELSGTRCSA